MNENKTNQIKDEYDYRNYTFKDSEPEDETNVFDSSSLTSDLNFRGREAGTWWSWCTGWWI